MIRVVIFAPPFTGELSAKLTEGADQAQSPDVRARVAPSDRCATTSPVNGGGK